MRLLALDPYEHWNLKRAAADMLAFLYNALYRHDKGFQFNDASFASQAKASIPLVGWGTHFFDYDNDGWLDLFVANGHVSPQVERAGTAAKYAQRKLLYRKNRDGTFTEAALAGRRDQRTRGQPRLGGGGSRQRR